MLFFLSVLALGSDLPQPAADAAVTEVRATLGLEDAARHLVDVEIWFPAAADGHDFFMPSWTPGSYKIRDFARQVEGVSAWKGDQRVTIEKVAKNRWRVEEPGAVSVRYRVFAHEMGVQTSFVDDEVAILNGAGLFLFEVGEDHSVDLQVQVPSGWSSYTGLDPHPGGEAGHYLASGRDELIDSPIVVGEAQTRSFLVGGARHELVDVDFDATWDSDRAVADVAKLVEAHVAFWGRAPYGRYVFLNVATGGGGGLEHLDSTLMMTGRSVMSEDASYESWLGLVSHEFFHTWNVKRLRPVELGPFDYEKEVYTDGLWVAEGLTSYYGGMLLLRSKLIDQDAYLEGLSKAIDKLQATPGRSVRSVETSSFDAWIKHYQRDENTKNTSVSYYTKGQVVGFLLDAEIRRRSEGKRSLDDAMRLAYQRYSGQTGYSSAEFREVLSEVAGEDLESWLDAALSGTDELALAPALDLYGLALTEPEEASGAWLGVGRQGAVLNAVTRGGPAWDAGLAVGDEVLAVNGLRASDLSAALKLHGAGDEVTVLLSRRGRIEERTVTLGEVPRTWSLEWVEKPTRAQRKARASWLGEP